MYRTGSHEFAFLEAVSKLLCSEFIKIIKIFVFFSSKTHEGFNESNIKTPNFEASTRSFFRSSEQECSSAKKSQQLSPKSFKMPHPINFNRQFASYPQNMDQTNTFDTRFPFQLNDVMNGSQKINIRIREMHYDLSVDGRDVTEFFIPNCNSTYKNAIPALGNLTINNTIPNIQNLQVLQPAIKYDVDQIRSEPIQKVNENPDLDLSNSSVIDTFEEIKICDSSREEYNSKGKNKKTYKKKAQKKNPKKKNQKLRHKNDKCENNAKEIVPVNTIVSTSEKLELSYSDVVKLSPKNDLRETRSSKPAIDSKKQVDMQQNKKNSGEALKSYRRIIDPDTSTEDIVEEKVPTKSNKKDEKLNQQKKVDIPAIQKDVKKTEKAVDPKQSESQKSKENNPKEGKKSKASDKPEISNKSEVPKKPPKSYKSKENKKLVEVPKIEMPTKSQGETDKQKGKQKSKKNENEEKSCKNKEKSTKDLKTGGKKDKEPDLQYDENGVPFRNVGGFILRYEENNSDSDSSVDDTEFFRRVHAEIRKKKATSKK